MKKYLSIFLGMLLVLGFAASAFAIHADIPSDTTAVVSAGGTQITITGEVRTRYDWQHVSFENKGPEKQAVDERVRLGLEAKVTPNTTGMIQLESTNENAASNSQDLYAWGTGSSKIGTNPLDRSNATGIYTVGNNKKGSLSILQAWLMHAGSDLLGVTSGFKIGHMPLALGNSLFFDHTKFGDDAIVAFLFPVKELELDAVNIRFRGGFNGSLTQSTQDNAYAFIATYRADKDTTLGFDMTYVDDQDAISTLTGGATTGSSLTNPRPVLHFWNFGLNGKTAFSGFNVMGDVEVQTGQTDHLAPLTGAELKFSGYAFKAGVGYTLAPVKLTVDGAYGSGDKGQGNKFKGFVTSLGADPHFTYVYEYRTVNAAGIVDGGLTNTWYLKLGANADVMKDLNVDAGLYYLQAARKITSTSLYSAFGGGFKFTNSSKDIGEEFDAKITYTIDRNLKYWVEGGYLWAGDFWHAVTGPNKPADAYSARQGIILVF